MLILRGIAMRRIDTNGRPVLVTQCRRIQYHAWEYGLSARKRACTSGFRDADHTVVMVMVWHGSAVDCVQPQLHRRRETVL